MKTDVFIIKVGNLFVEVYWDLREPDPVSHFVESDETVAILVDPVHYHGQAALTLLWK